MTIKRTVTTVSCQFQLRLPWDLRDKIEARLEEGQSLGGWIKEACEMRLEGRGPNKSQDRIVPNISNKKRVAEIRDKFKAVIAAMSADERSLLLGERYPKARFSERSGISKDSVRRYWGDIEALLKE